MGGEEIGGTSGEVVWVVKIAWMRPLVDRKLKLLKLKLVSVVCNFMSWYGDMLLSKWVAIEQLKCAIYHTLTSWAHDLCMPGWF